MNNDVIGCYLSGRDAMKAVTYANRYRAGIKEKPMVMRIERTEVEGAVKEIAEEVFDSKLCSSMLQEAIRKQIPLGTERKFLVWSVSVNTKKRNYVIGFYNARLVAENVHIFVKLSLPTKGYKICTEGPVEMPVIKSPDGWRTRKTSSNLSMRSVETEFHLEPCKEQIDFILSKRGSVQSRTLLNNSSRKPF